MSDWVKLERDGQVAVITLNDPARKNALSPELGDAFKAALKDAEKTARAIVITGSGGSFSSGGDLRMLERLRVMPYAEAVPFMLAFYGRYLCVRDIAVPVIAAVEGHAVGAGFCLALASDLMVVAEDAQLALNFSKLGLGPGLGATYTAPRMFGHMRAFELMATGRMISGKEAASMTHAITSAPSGGALRKARDLATTIAANAPLVLKEIKRRSIGDPAELQQALQAEAEAQAKSYASRDFGEGLEAAKARRAPVFEGA